MLFLELKSEFHDHEGFYTKKRSKLFAIMVALASCGSDEAPVTDEAAFGVLFMIMKDSVRR
jgi:hypothetical protein